MLTTVFSLHGNDNELNDIYRSICTNAKLIRRLDPKRHISLLVKSRAGLDDLSLFDRVYEYDWSTNDIGFLAKALPSIDADQVLYLSPRMFCMDALTRAFERNFPAGVFFPENVLDFRGLNIATEEAWNEQKLFSKHNWPILNPKLLLFNNDDNSREFFKALDLFFGNWENIGAEISEGAMVEDTWDNLIAFTGLLHPELYRKTKLLNFRSLVKRDNASDKNWMNKKWHDWLDVWWVAKDGFYLRIENFRQQGFIELTDDCLISIEQWLAK